jgi:acetyltransferase-like isoleucine patch superfamily enzyme
MPKFHDISPKATIHKSVQLSNFIEIRDHCVIGEGTRIGSFVVMASGTWIGRNCNIHGGAMFADDTKLDGDRNPPRIENNVRFGTNVKVMGGVVIHDNAVIGANSTVFEDVPEGEVWAGTPARKIR